VKTPGVTAYTVAGVDIGGTKVTFVLWSDDAIAYRVVLPCAARSSREFAELILQGMGDLRQQASEAGTAIIGTGIGCAGMVDQKRGVLLFPPNMPGVRDVALADIVSEATGVPTYVENDANCALFAEWTSGVAVGRRNVVMFAVGTGVGGALIVDGHLHIGRHGFAGEIGHLPMVERGLSCGCGRHGCLETIASGSGIERYVKSALARGSKSLMTMKDAESARTIAEFAHHGDLLARQAFKRAARYLGRAAAALINTLDPDMVVLGGGVAESGLLMDGMKRVAQQHSLPLLFEGIEFAVAHYKNDAGAVGAALLADQLLKGQTVYSM